MAIFINADKKEVKVTNSVDIAEWEKAGFKKKPEPKEAEPKEAEPKDAPKDDKGL